MGKRAIWILAVTFGLGLLAGCKPDDEAAWKLIDVLANRYGLTVSSVAQKYSEAASNWYCSDTDASGPLYDAYMVEWRKMNQTFGADGWKVMSVFYYSPSQLDSWAHFPGDEARSKGWHHFGTYARMECEPDGQRVIAVALAR